MREFISNSIPCQNSYVAFRPFAGTDPRLMRVMPTPPRLALHKPSIGSGGALSSPWFSRRLPPSNPLLFELGGRQHPVSDLLSDWVVEHPDVIEHVPPGFLAAFEQKELQTDRRAITGIAQRLLNVARMTVALLKGSCRRHSPVRRPASPPPPAQRQAGPPLYRPVRSGADRDRAAPCSDARYITAAPGRFRRGRAYRQPQTACPVGR